MSDRRTTPRNILKKLLKQTVTDGYYENRVVPADLMIDQALDDMETEEPTFLSWLETSSDVDNALRVHEAAVYKTIVLGQTQGLPVEQVVQRIGALTYRLSAAIALQAARLERSKNKSLENMWGTD